MHRVAVFVDAGYFFAQGSTALTGSRQEQRLAVLDQERLLQALQLLAFEKSGHSELLRIYWYDGVPPAGQTAQQRGLASTDNVKLRLGLINEHGKQKGVDSLIVTDLVELARNRAISDALLLSGDEDMRIGVEIAQSLGVRVHLLGIVPSRGSQARSLLSEADTTTEWCGGTIAEFLAFPAARASDGPKEAAASNDRRPESESDGVLREVVAEMIRDFSDAELTGCRDALGLFNHVPREYDGRLLATCRTRLGRDLNEAERSRLRQMFGSEVGDAALGEQDESVAAPAQTPATEAEFEAILEEHVLDFVGGLSDSQIRELLDFWSHSREVPPEHDRPLLASCGNRIGRALTPDERRSLRSRFQKHIEERHAAD